MHGNTASPRLLAADQLLPAPGRSGRGAGTRGRDARGDAARGGPAAMIPLQILEEVIDGWRGSRRGSRCSGKPEIKKIAKSWPARPGELPSRAAGRDLDELRRCSRRMHKRSISRLIA